MKTFFNKIEKVTKNFSMIDIGVLKFCLLALGIILGVYFSEFFGNILLIIWAVFVLTWLFIVIKVFGFYWDKTE